MSNGNKRLDDIEARLAELERMVESCPDIRRREFGRRQSEANQRTRERRAAEYEANAPNRVALLEQFTSDEIVAAEGWCVPVHQLWNGYRDYANAIGAPHQHRYRSQGELVEALQSADVGLTIAPVAARPPNQRPNLARDYTLRDALGDTLHYVIKNGDSGPHCPALLDITIRGYDPRDPHIQSRVDRTEWLARCGLPAEQYHAPFEHEFAEPEPTRAEKVAAMTDEEREAYRDARMIDLEAPGSR